MRARRHDPEELLRGIPLFADSSDDEIALVVKPADEVTVPRGHELIHEGRRGGSFVMLGGTADVTMGEEHVRTLGAGDFLGEIAMVLGSRSTATVVATSDVHALCLSESSFDRVINRSPGLKAKIQHEAWRRPEGTQAHSESP
jgi:CRP-like cAMP-binding protein